MAKHPVPESDGKWWWSDDDGDTNPEESQTVYREVGKGFFGKRVEKVDHVRYNPKEGKLYKN